MEFHLQSRWELTLRMPPPSRLASILMVLPAASDEAQRRAAELIVKCGVWAKVSACLANDDTGASSVPLVSPAEINGTELASGASYLLAYGAGDDPMSALLFTTPNGFGVTVTSTVEPNLKCRVRLELGGASGTPVDKATADAALAAFAEACVSLHAPPPPPSSASHGGVFGGGGAAANNNRSMVIPPHLASTLVQSTQVAAATASSPAAQAWTWLHDLSRELHAARLTAASDAEGGVGPRVMICGTGRGTGRSTACRALSSYAVRAKFHPILISASLDGSLGPAPPGCLSATVVQHPLSVEDGLHFVPSVHAVVPFGQAISQHQEHAVTSSSSSSSALFPATPGALLTSAEGRAAYTTALQGLVEVADQRAAVMRRCRCAGVLLDAPTDDGSAEYCQLLIDIVRIVGIDTVVFVGNSANLRARFRNALILKSSLSTGVADMDDAKALEKGLATPDVVTLISKRLLSAAHTTASLQTQERLQLWQVPPLPGARRTPALTDVDRAAWITAAAWRCTFFGTPSSRLVPTTVTVPLSRLLLVSLGVRSDERLQGLLPMADDRSGGAPTGPVVEAKVLHALGDFVEAVSTNSVFLPSDLASATAAVQGAVLGLSSLDPADGQGSPIDRIGELLCVCGYAIVASVLPGPSLELVMATNRLPGGDDGRSAVVLLHQKVKLVRTAAT